VEPQTLLLDEPLSNLDANLREEMRFEIRRLHQEYKYTTVYVTHDQAEAMTAADLIVVMNGGKIEQVGSPEEVYRHPRSRFVAGFIGGANISRAERSPATRSRSTGWCCAAPRARPGAARPRCRSASTTSASPTRRSRPRPTPLKGPWRARSISAATGTTSSRFPAGCSSGRLAPMALDVAAGAPIYVYLPPEHCRALAS
jgi:iron(III) transport system ATP-binding protein